MTGGMTMKGLPVLHRLCDLPGNARVALYGAGEGGARFLRKLRQSRPDVDVVCFVDDSKTGRKDGVPVVSGSTVSQIAADVDQVLVTSAYWPDILHGMSDRGVDGGIVVHPRLYYEYLLYSRMEAQKLRARHDRVGRLLCHPLHRRLYELLVRMRRVDSIDAIMDLRRLLRRIPHEAERQYMEHICPGGLGVVIEGGVLDGVNTRRFREQLMLDGVVYGFDPLLCQPRELAESLSRRRRRVDLSARALWKRRGKLRFLADSDNREGSRLMGLGRESIGRLREVDAISVDELVIEKGIQRVDLIKLDVEGAELPVLQGARRTLVAHRPQLAISIYHSKQDMVRIPLWLESVLKGYRHFLGHYSSTYWDTVWYAVPEERLPRRAR